MKLKNIFVSTLISATFLSLGTESLTASASTWKNGVPGFVKLSKNQAWMSTTKVPYTSINNHKSYSRIVLFADYANNGIGTGYRGFNNKGNSEPIGGGYPILPTPYYKKTSKNIYLVKTNKSQSSFKPQAKIKKDGKNIKVWLNEEAKKWRYLGVMKKVNLSHVDKYKKDPLR